MTDHADVVSNHVFRDCRSSLANAGPSFDLIKPHCGKVVVGRSDRKPVVDGRQVLLPETFVL